MRIVFLRLIFAKLTTLSTFFSAPAGAQDVNLCEIYEYDNQRALTGSSNSRPVAFLFDISFIRLWHLKEFGFWT